VDGSSLGPAGRQAGAHLDHHTDWYRSYRTTALIRFHGREVGMKFLRISRAYWQSCVVRHPISHHKLMLK
jgi:hypothetical protein